MGLDFFSPSRLASNIAVNPSCLLHYMPLVFLRHPFIEKTTFMLLLADLGS